MISAMRNGVEYITRRPTTLDWQRSVLPHYEDYIQDFLEGTTIEKHNEFFENQGSSMPSI